MITPVAIFVVVMASYQKYIGLYVGKYRQIGYTMPPSVRLEDSCLNLAIGLTIRRLEKL